MASPLDVYKPKRHPGTGIYVIRIHVKVSDRRYMYYCGEMGFGPLHFAEQYTTKDYALRKMKEVTTRYDLVKSLDEYDEEDIDFDRVEIYEIQWYYVNPGRFYEFQSKNKYTNWIRRFGKTFEGKYGYDEKGVIPEHLRGEDKRDGKKSKKSGKQKAKSNPKH